MPCEQTELARSSGSYLRAVRNGIQIERMARIKHRKKHKKQRRQENKQKVIGEIGNMVCKCGAIDFVQTPRTFRDGTHHIEVRCAKCSRFIKWLRHYSLTPRKNS